MPCLRSSPSPVCLCVCVCVCQGQGKKALSSKIYLNRATARSKLGGQSQLEEAVRDCNAALAINAAYLKVTLGQVGQESVALTSLLLLLCLAGFAAAGRLSAAAGRAGAHRVRRAGPGGGPGAGGRRGLGQGHPHQDKEGVARPLRCSDTFFHPF